MTSSLAISRCCHLEMLYKKTFQKIVGKFTVKIPGLESFLLSAFLMKKTNSVIAVFV